MSKIIPAPQLLTRRNTAIASMAQLIIEPWGSDTYGIIFNLENINPKYLSFTLARQTPTKARLKDISQYVFEEVSPHHRVLVPKPDRVDNFFRDLQIHAQEEAVLNQNRIKGTAELIITPERLVDALTAIAQKQGIDVNDPEGRFAKCSKNALADTNYLTRMTKKAVLQPLLQ